MIQKNKKAQENNFSVLKILKIDNFIKKMYYFINVLTHFSKNLQICQQVDKIIHLFSSNFQKLTNFLTGWLNYTSFFYLLQFLKSWQISKLNEHNFVTLLTFVDSLFANLLRKMSIFVMSKLNKYNFVILLIIWSICWQIHTSFINFKKLTKLQTSLQTFLNFKNRKIIL